MEHGVFIIWNNNIKLIKQIKRLFGRCLLHEEKINLSENQKYEKMAELFHPHKVRRNDKRVKLKTPIIILVVRDYSPIYEHIYKNFMYSLCNTKIINMKCRLKQTWSEYDFYSSNNITEAYHAFRVYNLNKFIQPYELININKVYSIIDNKAVRIEDTPQFRYLVEEKKGSEKYDNLINNFSYSQYNRVNNYLIKVYKHEDYYVIQDGIRRTALHRYYGMKYIKAKIITGEIEPVILCKADIRSHVENLSRIINCINAHAIRYVCKDYLQDIAEITVYVKDYMRFKKLIGRLTKYCILEDEHITTTGSYGKQFKLIILKSTSDTLFNDRKKHERYNVFIKSS